MSKLNELNERLNKIKIKGKEYAQVNQRILGFWELYPEGRIITRMMMGDDTYCLFKAEIYSSYEAAQPIATGHAREEKTGMINSTSFVENCETSAVGRALGMLGIGATESIASAEEVQRAVEQQDYNTTKYTTQPVKSPQRGSQSLTEALELQDARARVTALTKECANKGIAKDAVQACFDGIPKRQEDFTAEQLGIVEGRLANVLLDAAEEVAF